MADPGRNVPLEDELSPGEAPSDPTTKNTEGGAGSLPANAKKGWVGQLDSSTFSIEESIGGVRGAIESLLPGLVFIVAYVVTRELVLPLILSGSIAVIFTLVRLVQKSPLTQAFSGLLGVGIGVVWAALSGQAQNYFAWGLVTNAFFFLVFLLSILFRKPAVAVIIPFVKELPDGWAATPVGQVLSSRATSATWVWTAVFGLRFFAQAPFYFAGNVVWLGVLKLVLGLPLFALGGWLTWVLLRKVLAEIEKTSVTDKDGEENGPQTV